MPINKTLTELLAERELKQRDEFQDADPTATTGSALWDFWGQAKWGGAEQLSFSTLGVYDAYMEGQYGESADTYEEMFAGDAAGDWSELSNSGRAGYMIGSALGMIPSFMVGGKMAQATIGTAAKTFGLGMKIAAKKSTQELTEAAAKIPMKKGVKSASELLGDNAGKFVDDAYETMVASNSLRKIEGALASELIEGTMKQTVRKNMADVLKIADDEILDALSDQTVKIVSRNNPENAMQMMNMVANSVPGLRGRPYAPLILGAMGYDAAIGVAMASIHNSVDVVAKKSMGVEKDDFGQYKYTGDYDVTMGGAFTKWLGDAAHEAAFFSILGPVKYIKGGTTGDNFSRLKKIFTKGTKAYWKPLPKYTNEELRAQLTAMNEIAGKRLGAGLKDKKWANKPDGWWNTATSKEGTAEMAEFLGAVRGNFIKSAPKDWAVEFGRDVFKSLPRMGAGIVAMNSFGLGGAFYNNGLSWDTLQKAMGESGPEIAANIMTAMYFTRKPHSFNVPATEGILSSVFQQGKIKSYMDGKHSKLRKTMGVLETFGMEKSQLEAISYIYANENMSDATGKANANNIMRQMDSTPEFASLEKIFKPLVGQEAPGGTSLKDAFNKNVSDLVRSKDLTMDEAAILQDKLFIAEKIIDEYNRNSSKPIAIDKYTPEQAFEIVKLVSSMEFNGKRLSVNNINPEIKEWRKKTVVKAIGAPLTLFKKYMQDTYDALNIPYREDPRTGELELPRLTDINEAPFTAEGTARTFATVYDYGVKNNWIKPGKLLEADQRPFTAEEQAKATDIWRVKSEELMDHVYTPEWKETGRELDEFILRDPSWHMTYDTALKMGQRHRAYELLTGGKEHGLPAGEASRTYQAIQEGLVNRIKPKLLKPDKDAENFGEVNKFIDDLYDVVRDLNPDIDRKSQTTLTFEKATSLKERVENQLGDVFSNPDALRDFRRDIMDISMDRLGMNSRESGIDLVASYNTLRKSSGMNYQEDGSKVRLPSTTLVRSTLRAMRENNKISQETYDSLTEHYEKVINAATRSRVPMEIIEGVTEFDGGDWFKAIVKSKATGEIALDEMAYDRASQVAEFFTHEIDKLNSLVTQLAHGANNIVTEKKDQHEAEMRNAMADRDIAINLNKIIKTALKDRDPYVLRAVARQEGDIKSVIEILSRNPMNSTRIGFQEQVVRITENIKIQAKSAALHESSIKEFVLEEMKKYNIEDKDVKDTHARMTANIFSNKYGISLRELDRIFDINESTVKSADDVRLFAKTILGDYYDSTKDIPNLLLKGDIRKITDTLNRLSGDIVLTNDNFIDMVVKPLRAKMELTNYEKDATNKSSLEIDQDLYAVTSNYYSKTSVKTLKLDLSSNSLIQGYRVVGKTENRGLTGIIEALDPGQNSIYLAETAGVDVEGRQIIDINTGVSGYNGALKSRNFTIYNPKAELEYHRTQDIAELKNTNMQESRNGEQWEIIPINEGTSLFVRVDRHPESIHQEIRTQFGENGRLYKILEAVYDGDLGKIGPEYEAMRSFLETVRGDKEGLDLKHQQGISSVVQAVKLTRMLLNMPMEIKHVLDNGSIDLQHERIKDNFKRDKLNETKNGFIPTDNNRFKTNLMFENSQSELFRNVHEEIRDWLVPGENGEFRKVKTMSIDDAAQYDSNTLKNVFDSLDRHKIELDRLLLNGDISEREHLRNLEANTSVRKSIVDGETFVTRDLYLASMGMIGLDANMLRIDSENNVIGFKSGGIKPTITHSKVTTEGKGENPSYGAIEQWFGKTAMKYNPLIEPLLRDLGVDLLTFKSANKINRYKVAANEEETENYAEVNGISEDVLKATYEQTGKHMPWYQFVENNVVNRNAISEIPFEAFSLRTIAREKDATMAQSTGVHMSDNNGIANWIGINGKINRYETNLGQMFTDPYYRTALAQKVFGALSETGDPSMMDSAINSILTRDGLIIEPWAQKKLEDNLINYFINNGAIAGGQIRDGSLDVMHADYGTLKSSIRSDIGDRPTVRYYGEFLPSYYASQKKFKKPGELQNEGIQNVIIQRISYRGEDGNMRKADGFLVEIGKEKFLQIEGRYVDRAGNLRDIDTLEPTMEYSVNNKAAYRSAEAREREMYDLTYREMDATGKVVEHKVIDSDITLADAALAIRNIKSNGVDLAIGTLNSRMPRNTMGDVVINKIAIVRGKAHMPKRSGNVSMMNAVDAIRPQDADFDFDKSFNYTAAPGEFWRETNKLAGFISGSKESPLDAINRLFDPNATSGWFSDTLPDLLGTNYSNDKVLHEVNLARGRFVKMHQVATYLSNIFKDNPLVLDFTSSRIFEGQRNLQVRINQRGKYVNMVDNITKLAERFIDAYKNLPSETTVERIREIQNEVYFGKDGVFEIGYESQKDPGKFVVREAYDLTKGDFRPIMDAINNKLIDPIGRYLKYNKGVEVDEAGIKNAATIEDYNFAFENLYKRSLDPSVTWDIDQSINFSSGLHQARLYFDRSNNPYDIAMRGMHRMYKKMSSTREMGEFGKGKSMSQEIKEYIEGGYEVVDGISPEAKHNKIFNTALREYVKDEARILSILEFRKKEQSLKIKIEAQESYLKGKSDGTELTKDRAKLARVQDLLIKIEESVSYMLTKGDILPENRPTTIFHYGYGPGAYRNMGLPKVILDRSGNIKEVIKTDGVNINKISKQDKIVENGRRYEVTDGQQQQGLRILAEAFQGDPIITSPNGETRKFTSVLEKQYLDRAYKQIQAKLITLGEEPRRQRHDFALYSERRKSVLFDSLFKNIEDPFFRKALILRLLQPHETDLIVSIRSTNQGEGKKAVYDTMYYENKLNQPVMSLLSSLASGEYRPQSGLKDFAIETLDQITILKNAAQISSRNPNIDIEQLAFSMYTEPGSLKGYLTETKMLEQSVFDKRNSLDAIEREAAMVMIEYASGKLIDPVVIYKAQKVMEKAGISLENQWGRKDYARNEDGSIRDFGTKSIFISERDALRRKDLGERGGVQVSTVNRTKNIVDCMRGVK